jgi:hypothetical protein
LASRRVFLRVGLAGAAAFAMARLLDAAAFAQATPRARDVGNSRILAAFVPVILEGALPTDDVARPAAIGEVIAAFERAVAGMSPAVRAEVDDLFALFRVAPMRIAFTGLWQPVEETPPAELAAFLARWRTSSYDIQRAGYRALTQLVQAAWYDQPLAWRTIGYPGPPAL